VAADVAQGDAEHSLVTVERVHLYALGAAAWGKAIRGRSVLRCSGRANHQDPVTPPNLPGGKPGSGPPLGRNFQKRIDMGETAWGAARRNRTEGRSSVSIEQRENLEAILGRSALPVGSDVSEQRRRLRELISAQPPSGC
jgi:hypothetical protein